VHRVLGVPLERMRVTLLAADDLRIPPPSATRRRWRGSA
jgi:hypothetical protein